MKNLIVYSNSEKKFSERLLKAQIDNSLKMGWEKKDIVLIENKDQVGVAGTIAQLLNDGVVKEAQLWWYHDLDLFQLQPMDSSQIDLQDFVAGFMDDGTGKLDTTSFFFRKDSERIFGWIRNRAIRLRSDEATALASLASEDYRDINSRYIKLSPKPTLFTHK